MQDSDEKGDRNWIVDFLCGFSIIGWVIILFRMRRNRIAWEAFVVGIVAAAIVRLVLSNV